MLTIWIVRPVFLQEKYWEKAKAQRRFFCREEERRSEREGMSLADMAASKRSPRRRGWRVGIDKFPLNAKRTAEAVLFVCKLFA